jgi:hypothetical protein
MKGKKLPSKKDFDRLITQAAMRAGIPNGWYKGPWFDAKSNLQTGIPPSMRLFVSYILWLQDEYL